MQQYKHHAVVGFHRSVVGTVTAHTGNVWQMLHMEKKKCVIVIAEND